MHQQHQRPADQARPVGSEPHATPQQPDQPADTDKTRDGVGAFAMHADEVKVQVADPRVGSSAVESGATQAPRPSLAQHAVQTRQEPSPGGVDVNSLASEPAVGAAGAGQAVGTTSTKQQ